MNEVKKVLFIINKFAGTGYQPALEGKILERSDFHNIECRIEFTDGPGHATELSLAGAREGYTCIVAVGGDGTLNEVGQGLVGSSVPMGIIARGSGNGLARHLSVPLKTALAIENIFRGTPLPMDTFTLNGKLSLNVSGIGFDGHIANLFGGKTKRGLAGYTKLILREYMSFKEFACYITINGEEFFRKGFVLAVANSSQYGNNACIAPAASVTDGLLHINLLRKVPAYRFDFFYDFVIRNVHRSSFVEMREIPELSVRTDHPVPYHVDGEPCGENDTFEIKIRPSSLQVVVPAAVNRSR